MRKDKLLVWSLNLWFSYAFIVLVIGFFDRTAASAFSMGAIGSQLVLLMMYEDIKAFLHKGVKTVKLGFYKRYMLNAIVLGFSCTFGIKALIFAFLGLELTRLTLTTSIGEW